MSQQNSPGGDSGPVNRLAARLLLIGCAMFAFALFVMPPIYDVFCQLTGLNGKTAGRYEAEQTLAVNRQRWVKVQFIAHNNEAMPWYFKPETAELRVHPGQPTLIRYQAHNATTRDMVGQAIPSLVPYAATNYFHKTECFCFRSQPLGAGQQADLALQFIVDPDLPTHINTLTLAYTLFDITESEQPSIASATPAPVGSHQQQ